MRDECVKIGFFERIFFYSVEALKDSASLFPWNRDEEIVKQKEEFIMYSLHLCWCSIAMINTFVLSVVFLESVFCISHKIVVIVGLVLGILSMLPIVLWWNRKQYVQSYLVFKKGICEDEYAWFWEFLTGLLLLVLAFLPFVFIGLL